MDYGDEEGMAPMDDQQYQDHFRKTFITDNQKKDAEEESWTLHDMMIPNGQTAKLVRVGNPQSHDFRISEVCDRLKFIQPTPVVILAGAKTERPGKTMAGLCRAAFNTGAFVIDSGLGTSIERFCLRKGVMLLGVCPEAEVDYPRLNPANRTNIELANGHSHFFSIGKEKGKGLALKWGQETPLKFDLAKRISIGRKGGYGSTNAPQCKILTVVIGDNEPQAVADMEMAMNMKLPIMVLEGSPLCNLICSNLKKREDNPQPYDQFFLGQTKDEVLWRIQQYSRVVPCKNNSEDAASIVHLLLTISI